MTDQTPQRDQPPRDEVRPVMGDHPELEPDDQPEVEPVESDDTMARLLVPGIILLVIVLLIIGYFLFVA